MSEKEKQILQYLAEKLPNMTGTEQTEQKIIRTFVKMFPDLSALEKEKLLSFGEGIAFAKNRQKQEEQLLQTGAGSKEQW